MFSHVLALRFSAVLLGLEPPTVLPTAPEIKNTFFTRLGFSLDHEAGLYRLLKKAGEVRPT